MMYPNLNLQEIDGKASLIKGVYNRVVKDFGVGAKSFKITTYNDAPAGSIVFFFYTNKIFGKLIFLLILVKWYMPF